MFVCASAQTALAGADIVILEPLGGGSLRNAGE
jgi:hypothetical protein